MRRKSMISKSIALAAISVGLLYGQNVTYQPYIQPGDSGGFGPTDQIVVAWQTDETAPHPSAYSVAFGTEADFSHASTVTPTGRVVDHYLSADPVLAAISIPTAYGAHTDYYAVLSGLRYDAQYYYRVSGPAGFPLRSIHARKRIISLLKFKGTKATIREFPTPTQP
jgi:hypothetical protein